MVMVFEVDSEPEGEVPDILSPAEHIVLDWVFGTASSVLSSTTSIKS